MNSFKLSQFNLPYRSPSRPEELRQSNFLEQFDNNTLFYDIFFVNDKLVFLAPPIFESTWIIILENIFINDISLLLSGAKIYKSAKTYKIIFYTKTCPKVTLFGDDVPNLFVNSDTSINYNNVLYTLQKNNEIKWIQDWAEWHLYRNDIDTIIIYDNESDIYTTEELERSLAYLNCNLVIFSLPFKYGPGSYKESLFDSDYLQYAAFEHVRYRFCLNDTKLLNIDIDELLISNPKIGLLSEIDETSSLVFFKGQWVDVEIVNADVSYTHQSHNLINKHSTCPNKWLANIKNIPDKVFLRVHDYSGNLKGTKNTLNSKYFHFRMVNTNWKWKNDNLKYNREDLKSFHPEIYTRFDLKSLE